MAIPGDCIDGIFTVTGTLMDIYDQTVGVSFTLTIDTPILPTLSSTDLTSTHNAGALWEFHITAANPVDGGQRERALFRYIARNVNVADILVFNYWEAISGTWQPMPKSQQGADVVGYYGPPTGFVLPANYTATSLFQIQLAHGGSVSVTMTLVDLLPVEQTLATLDGTVTINDIHVLGSVTGHGAVSPTDQVAAFDGTATMTATPEQYYYVYKYAIGGTDTVLLFTNRMKGLPASITIDGLLAKADTEGKVSVMIFIYRRGDIAGGLTGGPDGNVGIADASLLINQWRKTTTDIPELLADLNCDLVVNVYDLSMMMSLWLP
jgi:hypothetical protein